MTVGPMCRCLVLTENTYDADEYVREHLVQGRSFADLWMTEYVCPRTEVRWLQDYPHSELHGGGPSRLRTASTVAKELRVNLDLAEFLFPDDLHAVEDAASLVARLRDTYEDPPRR